jgi:hypothetical protein
MSESQLIAELLRRRKPGDVVSLTFLRGGEKTTVRYAQQ